jgi:hypothetical protein
MTSPARHSIPLRWSVVAIVLAAMLAHPSLSGGATSPSSGTSASGGLKAFYDPAQGGTPLDLFGVRFGQTASTDLTLIIRTAEPWDTSLISPVTHTSLCMLLRSDVQANPAGRLCIYPNASTQSKLALRYTVLDQTGKQLGIRDLDPVVTRPTNTTVKVSFQPSLLRLKPGLYHWKVRSQFIDNKTCFPPNGCEDDLPNTGEDDLRITIATDPAARQRCFGAASRDVRVVCRNPKLAHEVVPTPDVAVITPNLPCNPLRYNGLVQPCEFGVPAEDAKDTVALIGDSHAAHWRSALEVVSQQLDWRGLSVTRSGCPFTKATTNLQPASRRTQCARWNGEVPAWLKANPQIHTVFVVAHYDASIVVPKGHRQFPAKVAGYKAAWRTLPSSVRRIIVIRDTPNSRTSTLGCISTALAKHEEPGTKCAVPRQDALARDPAVTAAAQIHSARIRTIDMTSFFCSSKDCFPVVGGALVYKDVSHLTDVFASSLGPYLLRKIRGLSAGG